MRKSLLIRVIGCSMFGFTFKAVLILVEKEKKEKKTKRVFAIDNSFTL